MERNLNSLETATFQHFATSIDAIEALRAEQGDAFATADEMEMLRRSDDCRRDLLKGYHNHFFIVDEYDAEAKADADRLAAEIAELNAAAAIPEGFELVESGTIKAGYISWDKADGGFVTYNFDAPEIMVSQCFLVGRPIVVDVDGRPIERYNGVIAEREAELKEACRIGACEGQSIHVVYCANNPANWPATIEAARKVWKLDREANKNSDIRPGQKLVIVDGSDNPSVYNGRVFEIVRIATDGESADAFARFNSNGRTVDVAHFPGDPANFWRPTELPDADDFAAIAGLSKGDMMRAETEDAERRAACSACGLIEGCHVTDCPNDPDNDPDAGDCPLCMLSNYAHRNNCEYGPDR